MIIERHAYLETDTLANNFKPESSMPQMLLVTLRSWRSQFDDIQKQHKSTRQLEKIIFFSKFKLSSQKFRRNWKKLGELCEIFVPVEVLRRYSLIIFKYYMTTLHSDTPVHKGGLNFVLEKNFNWIQTANDSYSISKTISFDFLQNVWKCAVLGHSFKSSKKGLI